MEILEKLKFQDRVIKVLHESAIVTDAKFTSKFGSSPTSRKQVSSALEYLIETGHISKKKGSTRFDTTYSLTAKGKDRVLYTFENEYVEQSETKERQRKHIEVSTLLAEDQRKYLLFTRKLSWASFVVSLFAIAVTIFFNYHNGHSDKKDRSYQHKNNKRNSKDTVHTNPISFHNSL